MIEPRFLAAALLVGVLVQAQTQTMIRPLFSSPERLAEWELEGSGKWAIRDERLVLEEAGTPSDLIRKPAALAVLRTEPLGDFDLKLLLRSTAPTSTIYRDLIVVFGYQSPTRFYYVHLSAILDRVHSGVFLVADAHRKRIDSLSSSTPLTDQNWHEVRIVRRVATGLVRVFVDDWPEPIMLAADITLKTGRIGVGSFDDTGEFRGLEVAVR